MPAYTSIGLLGLFPLPLGVWEGLRFVIVALSGLFSYLFCNLPTGVHCWFSFASAFQLFLAVLIVVSSLYLFDFYVLGDIALMR